MIGIAPNSPTMMDLVTFADFLLMFLQRSLNMESKFSHLSQRDSSVSMLRVKMSRRRSQTQKENRERTVNTRRQLGKLLELDVSSLDASVAMANMSIIHERTLNVTAAAKSKEIHLG